jgi:diguanylate cyclase
MRNRYATRFAVAMFDIDHFKKVNDVEGHLHGDHVLQGLARLLDDLARETDVVTRYGGEEFVIIMPETGLQGACIFAERVRTAVATQMQITLSCGVAESLDGDTQDSLLVRADQALYEAKASGRNAVFRHNGDCTERVESEVSATPV